MNKTKPATVASYLKGLSKEQRAALQKLRRDIKAAAPQAEECMAYGIPSYRVDGKMMVSIGAWAEHCAFYAGSTPLVAHKKDLKRYDINKGTIRFTADDPLSAALVKKLVRTQIKARSQKR
jgi:uncharacterized protein YdhG (YjbR/CyaY superfamily)